jgi:exonuclease III
MLFSFYKSNARGVGILFKRNLDLKVHQSFVDEKGNYIVLDLSVNSKQFTLINVYGPNTDQPKFYENIFRSIDDIDIYLV